MQKSMVSKILRFIGRSFLVRLLTMPYQTAWEPEERGKVNIISSWIHHLPTTIYNASGCHKGSDKACKRDTCWMVSQLSLDINFLSTAVFWTHFLRHQSYLCFLWPLSLFFFWPHELFLEVPWLSIVVACTGFSSYSTRAPEHAGSVGAACQLSSCGMQF